MSLPDKSVMPNKDRIWEYAKTGFWIMLINTILVNFKLMPSIGQVLSIDLIAILGFIVLDIGYGYLIETVAARSN